jgi:hypothetical protein
LKPPLWPRIFPAIDAQKWARGKAIFERADSCARCHQVLPRDDLTKRIEARMSPLKGPEAIGTDPWMACNAFTYSSSPGTLLLTPRNFFVGMPYLQDAQVSNLLGTVVVGSIFNRRNDLGEKVFDDMKKQFEELNPFAVASMTPDLVSFGAKIFGLESPGAVKARRLQKCLTESQDTLAYKGRPLAGVWATGPFLHNGSVPTLYDLLLPPAQRPTTFSLGTREFDPVKVGFANELSPAPYFTPRAQVENTFAFRVNDASGRVVPGNSNAGHDYGNASFTDEERWALVEYMKAAGAIGAGDLVAP